MTPQHLSGKIKRLFLGKIWSRPFWAVMVLTFLTVGRNSSFADDIGVLETQLRSGVHDANPAVGSPDNRLPKGFTLQKIAEGIDPIENPSGKITLFGFLSDGTPTEPDESTYLVLDHNPGGLRSGFVYGRDFLLTAREIWCNLASVACIELDL